jgi:hypothetical protein
LYMNNDNLGDAGAIAIAVALEHNTALKTLVLDSNGIGPAGTCRCVCCRPFVVPDCMGLMEEQPCYCLR